MPTVLVPVRPWGGGVFPPLDDELPEPHAVRRKETDTTRNAKRTMCDK
jgi:hypothetical protein